MGSYFSISSFISPPPWLVVPWLHFQCGPNPFSAQYFTQRYARCNPPTHVQKKPLSPVVSTSSLGPNSSHTSQACSHFTTEGWAVSPKPWILYNPHSFSHAWFHFIHLEKWVVAQLNSSLRKAHLKWAPWCAKAWNHVKNPISAGPYQKDEEQVH